MQAKTRNEDLIYDIRRRLDRPVVLIGLMGVGKTRLGRMIARNLDLDFVDSDHEIENAAGMEVVEIFDRFGESYFRDGEHRVIKRLLDEGIQVIATGGGAVKNPETVRLLREKAITIWIKADLDLMVERTSRNDKRPLLREGDSKKILRNLMEERYPVYEQADIVIESHEGPIGDILNDALLKLDRHLRKS